MSQITSGSNNGMYGKKHTKESKEKMSINSKGKTSGEKNGMYGKSKDNATSPVPIKIVSFVFFFTQTPPKKYFFF